MSLSFLTRAATLVAAAALALGPGTLRAQKALVYCPVAIDGAGCTTIVSALSAAPSAFPGGVDLGYDGAGGTVDLATVDLSAYAVAVVPSLADGDGVTPYAMLRDPGVAARLRTMLTGRTAVWSGTPDRGSTNRAAKDGLLRNLARWAMADTAAGRGAGLVVLQDNSDDPAARYAWLGGVSSLTVTADTTLEVYANVQVLTTTGSAILTTNGLQIGYSNMASYGLLPSAAGTVDASGGRTSRAVLVTTEAADQSSVATVRTDREDYAPGDTVVVTGAGWAPGETVQMSLHEDPLVHGDRTLTAVADAAGQIYNNQFVPEEHDFGVRFVLTAVGETSGRTAQTTFTDGNKLEFTTAAFTAATGTCSPAITVRLLQGNNPENGHPTPVALSSSSGGGTFYSNSGCTTAVTSVTIPTSSASVSFFYKDANPGTPTLTAVANNAGGCNGANCTVTQTETITTTTTTTVATSGTPSVFGQSVTFTASVTAAVGTVPTGGTVTFKDGAATLGTGTTNAGGQATFATTALSVGSHSITAVYAGTPAFPTSTSAAITQTVNQANTTTTITADTPDPSTVGQAVSVSYTVAAASPGAGTPTGNVTVSDGVNSCTGTVAAGSCSVTLSTSGARTLTATYAGEARFNGSTSAGVAHQVNVVNAAPIATADAYAVDEDNTLTVAAPGVLGNDSDPNGDALTAVLVANVSHGTLTLSANGSFTYTPAANYNGPETFTYRATDGSLSSAVTTVTITVNAVNDAPVLATIGNKTVDELTALTFTASATDVDVPANTLTYSLVGAPAGAAINASTGAFSWTPTEAQGPGSYTFTVKVTDNGTPTLSDEEAITVTVNEVNAAPILDGIGNKTVDEGALLAFTATATDPEGNPLTFSLDAGAPAGAAITTAGAFTWTPTEAQGPGTYSVTVRVSDGLGGEDTETITITVNEVNQAPVLAGVPASATIPEQAPYTFTATATDADQPAQTLTFSLVGAPAGATIDAGTGAFSWTPTEAQGPGTYPFSVRVSDGITHTDAPVTLTVTEVNVLPVITGVPATATIDEETAYTFDADATDADEPPQSLTFSLVGAPAGATINPTTGAFSWTPSEAQGPGTYTFGVRVSDGAGYTDATVALTVKEVNRAPTLAAIANKTVDELTALTFTASATDPDLPANTLTYALGPGAPAGASIDPGTGAFSWTPTEAQGPGSYTVTVVVSDGLASDSKTFTVTVNEVNAPPVVQAIANQSVDEGETVTFTAVATDPDIPANALTYGLLGAPAGATINPATGAFSWATGEADGPGVYTFQVVATDNGTPALSGATTVQVTVKEVNVAPVLASIGSKTVDELTALAFTATATDADLPPNALTYSLIGAPAGATINPTTGAFSWTPTEAQGPGSYTFTVKVTDDGSPVLSDEETITVTVNEVNAAPVLASIGNKTVDEKTTLGFTASATDPDIPANTLTYSLDPGAPAGASIDPTTGAFSWTPSEADGPGDYTVTVRVRDNGAPVLDDFETITVHVNEVNEPPVLAAIGNKTVDELTPLTFTASATDPDLPPNGLTFSLDAGAPAGATINPSTGAFSWTPTEAQGPGDYTITIRVTDNGTPALDDFETITVHVNEVNVAPVLASIGNKTVDELTALTFTASATDADLPANTLAYSLVGAPAGATINASTGAFSWTPTEAQGPGSYTFTVRVTDNGTPVLSDDETITVTVREVNEKPTLAAIASRTVNEGTPVTFTATATDPDVPANTLTYSLVGAPAGATINPSTGVFSWTPTDDAPTGTPSDVYSFTVRVTDNGTPALYDERTVTITVNNVAPTIAGITAPVAPVNITTPVTVTATFNDVGSGDTHTTLIAWGDGQTTSATVSETNGSGNATRSHTYADAGVYTIVVTVTDDDGGSVTQTYSGYVVVYDPSAGFVTGGGWIMSPAGAYLPAPSLTGKATFGFVSKYQKGASVPTGNTEFQFHATDFNFSSTSYDWLVVSGSSKASYKGEGTVNGSGRYGFMLSVVDGNPDKFRIKIWNKNAGDAVVYDNQMGAALDAEATTATSGGNIVVHATK